ncbi:MAG TPA: site-2 protease family protein [Gammaproteobacteria bacterium]
MTNGIRLGRIAGIEVVVDWSLLIIFTLITFSLAGGVFPSWHPEWNPALAWSTAVAAAVLFFASVLTHELSHALVGRAGGIHVRRITLFMFGGVAQMENEPPTWRSELVMAAIGPITSLVLGMGFLFLAGVVAGPIEIDVENPREALAALSPLATLLLWLGPVNILLAIFNLVPGFPLDGGRVLRAVLWGITGNLRRATRWATAGGQGFAWLLMGTGVLMLFGLHVPLLGGGPIGGLWLMFIGWFLNNAALMSYRQLLVKETLEDVPVARIMQTRFTSVGPAIPISELVDVHLMASGQRVFPVEEDGRLLGMVCLRDLRKAERSAWERITARDIMTPASDLVSVSASQDASEALTMLAQLDVNQLPVLEHGKLVGLLRREDVLKWLSVHEARAVARDRMDAEGRRR